MNNKIKNLQDLNEIVAKSANKRIALLATELPDDVIDLIKSSTVPEKYNYLNALLNDC